MRHAHSLLSTAILGCTGLAALLAIGCDPSTSGGGGGGPVGAGSSAALTGKVDPSVRAGVTGALRVTASRVNEDGSLTLVSSAAAQVGADGRYEVALVDGAAAAPGDNLGGATHLLVTAVADGDARVVGAAVVEAVLDGAATLPVAPIDAATTAEANLLIGAKSAGLWRSDFSFSFMRALLTDQVAASLIGVVQDGRSESAKAAARAIFAAAAGVKRSLEAQGVAEAAIVGALKATLVAEAHLDAELDAATKLEQANAIAGARLQALLDAFGAAGVTTQQLAVAFTAAADLMASYAASLAADAQAQLVARVDLVEAKLVTASVEAELLALGAGRDAVVVVADAGVTLQAQLEAAARAGAQVAADAQEAWRRYKAAVDAALQSAVSVDALLMGQLLVALAGDVQALDTALAQIGTHGSIQAAAIAEAQALVAFDAGAMSRKVMLLGAGLTDVQATAWITAELDVAASLVAAAH